jgi:hypothetical protein
MNEAIMFDSTKFKELLLYVCQKTADDPKCGATKLNKILFYSDFMAFAKFGKPITGATYQHLEHGPAPREFLPSRKALEANGEVVLVPRLHYGHQQKALVALREANLSVFGPQEIAMVDWVIQQCWEHNATSISEKSHELPGWRFAREGEDIPYESVFLTTEPLTHYEISRGREIALSLCAA